MPAGAPGASSSAPPLPRPPPAKGSVPLGPRREGPDPGRAVPGERAEHRAAAGTLPQRSGVPHGGSARAGRGVLLAGGAAGRAPQHRLRPAAPLLGALCLAACAAGSPGRAPPPGMSPALRNRPLSPLPPPGHGPPPSPPTGGTLPAWSPLAGNPPAPSASDPQPRELSSAGVPPGRPLPGLAPARVGCSGPRREEKRSEAGGEEGGNLILCNCGPPSPPLRSLLGGFSAVGRGSPLAWGGEGDPEPGREQPPGRPELPPAAGGELRSQIPHRSKPCSRAGGGGRRFPTPPGFSADKETVQITG